MRIFTSAEEIRPEKGTVVTIGTFDGVHLGHQKILARVKELAEKSGLESLVFTFHPHPRLVLFPDQRDLKLLNTSAERASLIEKSGIDILLEYPFTKEFSQIDPEKYVSEVLCRQLNVKKLVIGYDHRFGKDRRGSIDLLRELAPRFGFEVEEITAEDIDDVNVSSTRIRKALVSGDISTANQFLGYEYFVSGIVVEGKKLGRQIGFPTANILPGDALKLIPAIGIYAARVELKGEHFIGMMSVGTNPTTDHDNKIKVEVNIFDFDRDIYGQELKVSFVEWLRNEEKFSGLDELIEALKSDREKTKEVFKKK